MSALGQKPTSSQTLRRPLFSLKRTSLAAVFTFTPPSDLEAADPSVFDALLGSWRGGGQLQFSEGRTERLKCNAYYTGGGSQLGLAILCQGESSNIQIRSKLTKAGPLNCARTADAITAVMGLRPATAG